jgi:hypothetical protein
MSPGAAARRRIAADIQPLRRSDHSPTVALSYAHRCVVDAAPAFDDSVASKQWVCT